MAGIRNRDSGGPEHLYEESDRGRNFKLRPRRSLAPVGMKGKGQGYEAETREVLSTLGSAYCSLKRLGVHHKQNRECLLLTTETRQAPLTKC